MASQAFCRGFRSGMPTGFAQLARSHLSVSGQKKSRAVMSQALEKVMTAAAPPPLGPYSQAIKVNGMLYISGQLGLDPQTSKMVGHTAAEQADQVMKNMSAILEETGLSCKNLVKCTILLADMDDFKSVNEVYGKYLDPDNPPARACYACKTLPLEARVEIEAIAHL